MHFVRRGEGIPSQERAPPFFASAVKAGISNPHRSSGVWMKNHLPNEEERGDHYPETDVVVPVVRIEPAPGGATGVPAIVVEGTTPLHTMVAGAPPASRDT